VHAVTTTGRIESAPGSFNVVPERAQIWAEMRSIDSSWLTGARGRLTEQLVADAAARGVHVDLEWLSDQDPVPTDQSIQGVIGRAADAHGLEWVAVPSGAGHDAAHMAHMGPMGMIFVPSSGGRSHCPEEWTEISEIASGVDVLYGTVTQVDAAPRVR
jgi:N-carbamoyl-L-amino-acid hydrolase